MCILQCNGSCSRALQDAAVIKITLPRPPSHPFSSPRPRHAAGRKGTTAKNCYLHNSQSNARVHRFEDFAPPPDELKKWRPTICVAQYSTYFCFTRFFLLFFPGPRLHFHHDLFPHRASCTFFFSTSLPEYTDKFNRTHSGKNTRSCRYVIIARDNCICAHTYSSKGGYKQFRVISLWYINYNFIRSRFSLPIYYRSLHLQFRSENYAQI